MTWTLVAVRNIREFSAWLEHRCSRREIAFRRALVLMQDFTGVPAEPDRINPLSPVDLVIDHSVTVVVYGTKDAFERNMAFEFQRNRERSLRAFASFSLARSVGPHCVQKHRAVAEPTRGAAL